MGCRAVVEAVVGCMVAAGRIVDWLADHTQVLRGAKSLAGCSCFVRRIGFPDLGFDAAVSGEHCSAAPGAGTIHCCLAGLARRINRLTLWTQIAHAVRCYYKFELFPMASVVVAVVA